MSNNELLNMKRKALMLGLCGEYKKKWDSCVSKKELVDLVLDSNGVEFLADAITFGWGCSQEFLQKEFADFINGKYQRKKDGYTSELYVHHNNMVVLRSTITLVVGGEADIVIPDDFIGNLYICGGSHTIFGSERGEINLYAYGSGHIEIGGGGSPKINREDVKTSQWRK